MVVLVVALAVLATFRLTRLVVEDEAGRKFREAVERRMGADSGWSYLVNCYWCTSLWIGVPVAWVALVGWRWLPVQIAGVALAGSGLTGIIAVSMESE